MEYAQEPTPLNSTSRINSGNRISFERNHSGSEGLSVKPRNKPIRMKANSPFARNLKSVLEERGVSQKMAAELAGVSAPTVNDWLAGSQPADPVAVQRLCRSLKIDFEWALTGTKSQTAGSDATLAEIFDVHDEPTFSGIFKIEAKRLKRRGSE